MIATALVCFLLGAAFGGLIALVSSGLWLPDTVVRILARMTPEQLSALADRVHQERTRGTD